MSRVQPLPERVCYVQDNWTRQLCTCIHCQPTFLHASQPLSLLAQGCTGVTDNDNMCD